MWALLTHSTLSIACACSPYIFFAHTHTHARTSIHTFRYVAFCTLFHSMATASQPLLYWPWNTSFSQSSLRVATTAAPIVARNQTTADLASSPQEATRGAEFFMALEALMVYCLGYNTAI